MTRVDSASSNQSFKDHFSGHSGSYAEFRPGYPESLFRYLAECCRKRQLAWDCATGNGQAARSLARYFDRVIATDASEAQLESASGNGNIEFRVGTAEQSGLKPHTADLITVAQALHWFDIERFFEEAKRVLVRGGVLAVWSYESCRISLDCDAIIRELYTDIVGPYWPPERQVVDDGYRTIELPMPAISTPRFAMLTDWSVDEMLGYLRTWSASQRYIADKGSDPVSLIEGALGAAWGADSREVWWPLNVKIGRV